MKRIFLSTALALAMGSMASAQTVMPGHFEFGYHPAVSFPTEFSYDGKPRLMLWDSSEKSCIVYDENLNKEKGINLKNLSFDYQLEIKTEEREVKSVDETEKRDNGTWSSLEYFIEMMSNLNPGFTQDCLIFTPLADGGQRIDFDPAKTSVIYGGVPYYLEDYFGKKYPQVYYEEHDGIVNGYYVNYEITYTDWVDKGTTTENYSEELNPLMLDNINLNHNDARYPMSFYLSQTLFNSDDSYEYLVPKYKLIESNYSSDVSADYPSTSVLELTRRSVVTKASSLALCGFQVVSETGNVLQDLLFDNYLGGSYVHDPVVLTIGSNVYIAFDGNDSEGHNATVFYKLDRTTSSLQKVRTVPGGMSLSRTIANKGADIQVNFSDGNEKGSEVSVFSANGQKVKSVMVPAGQKSATFNVNGASGMYLVNRAQKGKANDTKKIIIK